MGGKNNVWTCRWSGQRGCKMSQSRRWFEDMLKHRGVDLKYVQLCFCPCNSRQLNWVFNAKKDLSYIFLFAKNNLIFGDDDLLCICNPHWSHWNIALVNCFESITKLVTLRCSRVLSGKIASPQCQHSSYDFLPPSSASVFFSWREMVHILHKHI